MKIHGICVVKNEGDVMRYFLTEAARWCDRICVLDNNSTDQTWDIVNEMAAQHPEVVPYRRELGPFTDALRGDVFNHFKAQAQRGDWWCRLDADEIYIDDPRAFLAAVPRAHHVVWSVHLQYYLTEADLARFAPDEEGAPLPAITAENAPRYYIANASEGRFFRHRPGLQWPSGAWPRHLGLVTPKRIRLKHLQYRSPAQARARFKTRSDVGARGGQMFDHWARADWKETLGDPAKLHEDRQDGNYVVDEGQMPRHLEGAGQRMVKRVMHGLGLWP
jgi:hypothetical protein